MDILRHFIGQTDGKSHYLNLKAILRKLERIPYENITKKWRVEQNKGFIHPPDELLIQHHENGLGGTCFSIVYLLKNILDKKEIESDFIFADRSYGNDTHCALLVYLDDTYICDPGYFIYKPVKIGARLINNDFNDIGIDYTTPSTADLSTIEKGRKKKRYTLKLNKVSEDDFISQWKASYNWPMMEQNIIMKKAGNKFYYMKDNYISIKSRETSIKKEISPDEYIEYAKFLGINLKSKLANAF